MMSQLFRMMICQGEELFRQYFAIGTKIEIV